MFDDFSICTSEMNCSAATGRREDLRMTRRGLCQNHIEVECKTLEQLELQQKK
jgi:hypothetical protein